VFEKERALLAHIRAGDRNTARRILNEMLATIYLTSHQLVVLRARTVEMMSCLTRAAIEDNPLMEPLIVRNHTTRSSSWIGPTKAAPRSPTTLGSAIGTTSSSTSAALPAPPPPATAAPGRDGE
jgi:hypothetical protein